ncbi:MAG: response regulator [Pseudomonadota bacterium]|nr:response regulator [Pseudomonadota bacterium]
MAVEAVIRTFRRDNIQLPVLTASDGREALKLLRGDDATRKLNSPPLIILYLNMAGMNGLEFLEALRADPALQHHLVFVWTTSDSCRDREACYAHRVAGYVLKSSSDARHAYMSQLVTLYRDHVKLPC